MLRGVLASGGGSGVAGSGTTNTIPRWTGTSTLGDSVITQSGSNIGINTASPLGTLDVRATNGTIVASNSATRYGFLQWVEASSLFRMATDGAFPLVFSTSGTERVRVTDTGNVGIGTASPNARLEIASTTAGTAQLRLSNASGLTNWWEIGRDNATTGALIFASNIGEQMRINPTGNVGIGTASPSARLTVAGTGGTAAINLTESGVRNWAIRAGGAATNLFDVADLTAGAVRLQIDQNGVTSTSDLATLNLSGTTASVAAGGTSASIFTPAAYSSYIVYIQATGNTGVMAHAMVTQNGAGTGALVSVTGSVLCTINNAGGALTITNNSGSAEAFRWRALKLRSLV